MPSDERNEKEQTDMRNVIRMAVAVVTFADKTKKRLCAQCWHEAQDVAGATKIEPRISCDGCTKIGR